MSARRNTARRVAQRASVDPSSAPASQQAEMDAAGIYIIRKLVRTEMVAQRLAGFSLRRGSCRGLP